MISSFIIAIVISLSVFVLLILGGWIHGRFESPTDAENRARRLGGGRGPVWVRYTPSGPPLGPPPEMTQIEIGGIKDDRTPIAEWKPLSAVLLPSSPATPDPSSRYSRPVSLTVLIRPPLPDPSSNAALADDDHRPVRTPDGDDLQQDDDIDVEFGEWQGTIEGDLARLKTSS